MLCYLHLHLVESNAQKILICSDSIPPLPPKPPDLMVLIESLTKAALATTSISFVAAIHSRFYILPP
ncbi:hypothetical protein Sjap_006523 [Stephania japonica]|uniref:Uncharacterized protein n=1 Tax=Stephania japonica TaxID=461633 RepID=A0AAP0PM20_9MAGN